MLSSKRRISKTTFKTFGRGTNYHSPLLSLFIYKKTNQLEQESPSQFSFSCSKKVAKSAVKRNLLRRRGYASIEKILDSIQSGFYFAFSFKKGAEGMTFLEIQKEVTELLKKSGTVA